MKISYTLDKKDSPKLHINYSTADINKTIFFKVPHDFFISSNSLAALSIACRPAKTSFISFDFPVSDLAEYVLKTEYKIDLKDTEKKENHIIGFNRPQPSKARHRNFLNFSGGVDSLGARYICADDVESISIDLGPSYAIERDFFEEWDTRIVMTNFRDKPFSGNEDWRFMSAGAILMSDYLALETIFFGTILEASPWWLKFQPRKNFEDFTDSHVFRLANLRVAYPVVALSEYGTTLLASKYGLDVLKRSIDSAAFKGTSKYFRKILLSKIVYKEAITDEWADANKPKEIKSSGSSFAEDILAMYFAHKLGFEFVDKYILKTDEKFKAAKAEINMSFFEKYNQMNLASIKADLKERIRQRMEALGIEPYSSEDAENITKLRSYLAAVYKFQP